MTIAAIVTDATLCFCAVMLGWDGVLLEFLADAMLCYCAVDTVDDWCRVQASAILLQYLSCCDTVLLVLLPHRAARAAAMLQVLRRQ